MKKLKKDKIDFEALGLLYFAVPVADVDEIAANFDMKKGELKPGKVRMAGNKALLLKESGLIAILPDLMYLSIFAVATLALAVPLFKRTL